MNKVFNFDMDGTIADLYGVEGWLADLEAERVRPYAEAKPLVNMSRLARALHKVQRKGYSIAVISCTSKGGSPAYNTEIGEAKKAWLKKHLPSVDWDNIFIIDYTTPKTVCGDGVLFDDEERHRNAWNGKAYAPDKIFEVLATA